MIKDGVLKMQKRYVVRDGDIMPQFNLETSTDFAVAWQNYSTRHNISQGDVLVLAFSQMLIIDRIKEKGYKMVVVGDNDVIVHDFITHEASPQGKKDLESFLESLK